MKKLIEVALPLEAINIASAREKSIRHGHPSTLHLWWARRPLAACRAVLFASLVNDPSSSPDKFPTQEAQDTERLRLFGIIERLVLWENSNNPKVLEEARAEILKHTEGKPPAVLDPFAGGGSIPLEAQRLGLAAHASDLNPVAVLINKAMIEIPPRYAGKSPVNPESGANLAQGGTWQGAAGLAGDVRYYGKWMRDEAEKRIGKLYPKATVYEHKASGAVYLEAEYRDMLAQTTTLLDAVPSLLPHPSDLEKQEMTVIAWIWARTVPSPNPAAGGAHVPLVRSFALSTKAGKEAWVEPVVNPGTMSYRFEVRTAKTHPQGKPQAGTIGKAGGRCILTGSPMNFDHARKEAQAGKMEARLMAIVAEGKRGRVYLSPTAEQERAAKSAVPIWKPEGETPKKLSGGTCYGYGLTTWDKLFTARQLTALSTFAELVGEAREKVKADYMVAHAPTIAKPRPADTPGIAKLHALLPAHVRTPTALVLNRQTNLPTNTVVKSLPLAAEISDAPSFESQAERYADAVATYLGFSLSRLTDLSNNLTTWRADRESSYHLFARQAIPMTWDYLELNPLLKGTGTIVGATNWTAESIAGNSIYKGEVGRATQGDAVFHGEEGKKYLIATDPPYYDNISYAALADFFYVWLRHTLRPIYPELFGTMVTPKDAELIADPYRHGGKDGAKRHFETGMRRVFRRICETADPRFPVSIIYAFKQSETEDDAKDGDEPGATATASTGWETFLQAMTDEGFTITGTWPMRTELSNRMIGAGSNALASSIVIVCRPRPSDAPTASRREFVAALRRELADALRAMMRANVAPVDLAQATIGPGMAVYSRYAQVLEPNGDPLRVRTALKIINEELDTVLAEQEGEYDADTRFCLAWFEQFGMNAGLFGDADVLARAKATSVNGVAEGGIIESRAGKVRLKKRDELEDDWNPTTDTRRSVWETCQHLIKVLYDDGSEEKAARLLADLNGAEAARDLAYRLYSICERKGWSSEALAYNSLVMAWSEVSKLSARLPSGEPQSALEL